MAERRYLIPERPRPGMRLGRHINHDPQSLRYLVAASDAAPAPFLWPRRIPILDQGDLGSCTANAAVGLLGSDPVFATLPDDVREIISGGEAESWAVDYYSEETRSDPFPGEYPPDDTGSDGLSAAKVAKGRGLISGYQHITSLAAAHAAGRSGPFIVGSVWTEGMFTPDLAGLVTATGAEAGGHEYLCRGYDPPSDRWIFDNSWTVKWGDMGRFYMTSATFAGLLAREGDATTFVPVTVAPPGPNPPPEPGSGFPVAVVRTWLDHKHDHTHRERDAAAAVAAWLAAQG